MKEMTGNLWSTPSVLKCIPTNMQVGKAGLVMGAGIAKQAKDKWPDVSYHFGYYITEAKFHKGVFLLEPPPDVKLLMATEYIASFPTKNFWKMPSYLEIIEKSCLELVDLVNWANIWDVLLPEPGTGLGQLEWEDVKPVLEKYFDDRFTVIHYGEPLGSTGT